MRVDKFGNPYLTTYWLLTQEERKIHFENVGKALLGHKYDYYVLDSPRINDCEYDFIERYYEAVAEDLGVEPEIINMVGFNESHKWAREFITRCKDCNAITLPGPGQSRCPSCWDDKCGTGGI